MIEALFNAVIVQPIELEETTFGNIVVPDLGNEKNKTAKVISVGPGAPLYKSVKCSSRHLLLHP